MTGYERIQWLCERLKRHRFPSRPQNIDQFEVSLCKRDLAFRRARLGVPIASHPRRQGYFLTDSDFELPSFGFDRRHPLILAGICRRLELFVHSPALAALRTRLLALLDPGGQSRLDSFSFETVGCAICDHANFDHLAEALRKGLTTHIKTGCRLAIWARGCVRVAGR